MASIHTFIVQPGAPEIGVCTKWRIEAFGAVLASTLQDEITRLEFFTADQARQVALMARCDGAPAGTCLLAQKELEPCHPVSPWLAGLYVTPEYRRRGVGRMLVRAIEDQARQRGNTQLYLYTDDAIAYYERLGWRVVELTTWKDYPMALMVRDLQA
jgi:GNAT superfamily N-acetyltransferase